MKRKIISAAVYAVTAFAFLGYFDGVYGGEPILYHLGLIHVATAGAILFAVATVLSLITLRAGIACGIVAATLSWPYFALELYWVPWSDFVWFAKYRPDTLTAIFCLICSTYYSINRLRLLIQGDGARQS
jgi:hypothetical protein